MFIPAYSWLVCTHLSSTTALQHVLFGWRLERGVKVGTSLFLCSQNRQQLHKDREEDTYLAFSISVSMETGWEGGTGRGVAMETDRVCMPVNECASVHVTLLDEGLCRARCLLKLSVFLWPLSLYRLWRTDGKFRKKLKGWEREQKLEARSADPRGPKQFITQ